MKENSINIVFSLVLLGLMILSSCDSQPSRETHKVDEVGNVEPESENTSVIESNLSSVSNTDTIEGSRSIAYIEKSDNCIFDLTTQTDDFIDSIPEIKNYSWNSETHTAMSIKPNGDTLILVRGGCDHFVKGIWKASRSDLLNDGDENIWIEEALMLGELIKREIAIDIVKEEIRTNEFHKEYYPETGVIEITFRSQYLIDNNYRIERETNEGSRKIGIYMYVN